jgi:putative holliday junction resolvase
MMRKDYFRWRSLAAPATRDSAPGMSSRPLALESLAPLLPPRARLMGVDLGTRTIGLALSDVERRIATPLATIARKKFAADARALGAEIARFEVVALVVGLPLNMNGEAGPRAQATRAFLRNFAALDATPVALWDERLSTAAVNRALIEHDVSRARRAAVIDRMAAAYILQGALDRLAAIAANAGTTAEARRF